MHLHDAIAALARSATALSGTPGEVARHPASPRVAWLLGTEAPRSTALSMPTCQHADGRA